MHYESVAARHDGTIPVHHVTVGDQLGDLELNGCDRRRRAPQSAVVFRLAWQIGEEARKQPADCARQLTVGGDPGGRLRTIPFVAVSYGLYAHFLHSVSTPLALGRPRMGLTLGLTTLIVALIETSRRKSKKCADENERLSGVDPLTGIANLRHMRTWLAEEGARCDALGTNLTLFTIDLDNFKQVNDTYSHAAGDNVLVSVARALQDTVRDVDLVARRGGDEFVVAIEHDAAVMEVHMAERIRANIAEVREIVCPRVAPTASIGAVLRHRYESVDDLIARADAVERHMKDRFHSEYEGRETASLSSPSPI